MGRADEKLEYLDEERKKIWAKIVSLEHDIEIRPSDYENEAKQASKKASEFRNRCEDSRNLAFQFQDEANAKLNEIVAIHANIAGIYAEAAGLSNEIKEKSQLVQTLSDEVDEAKKSIEGSIETLEGHYTNIGTYDEHAKRLEEIFNKNSDFINKTEVVYKNILARKKEFDQFYQDIFGFTEEDEETGEKTEIAGLKEELEESFRNANIDIEALRDKTQQMKNEIVSEYDSFVKAKNSELSKTIEGWNKDFQAVYNKIEELLPNALTAGLSYAYSRKKEDEVKESKKLALTFNTSIFGLVAVSLIPFGFSAHSLYSGRVLADVLSDMPRLVVAILPLYIPVLWVAYSASKKINLSKRLIEEYTHKEVLSKTFEGLSRQINDMDNGEISGDLRTRLLYNILEVSSENPGKLITDYNKSDHPLMDALDKSVKLADAVDKLSNIPGFSKLTRTLEQKSKRILEEKGNKANKGLELLACEPPEKDDEDADDAK